MWPVVRESLSLLAALTPGVFAAWDGRRLIRRLDDPAFPELKLARTGRLVAVAAGAVVASVLISSAFAMLKILLLVAAIMAGAFPLRRAMFRERWSFWRYAAFAARFWVAMLGTWILFALVPLILRPAGPYAPAVAAVLAVLLLAWAAWYRHVFAWIVGARPLEDGALREALDTVLQRAACPRLTILVAAARGGHWVNAFAVPSIARPAVVFTRDLLRLLDAREAAAIFAHEVAHLEHHTRRRVAVRLALLAALVAVIEIAFLAAGRDPSLAAAATWIWPLACLVAIAVVLGRSQAHERQSDLRALELSGDADALIAALTKIHHAMQLPRRWARHGERHQTHPSLARRIRAIGEAAASRGLAVHSPPVAETVLRAADDPSTVVILDEDRIHWLRGVPGDVPADLAALLPAAAEQRTVRYRELADLRLEVDGLERRFLVATDARGRGTQVALRPDDVPVVKRNLERIDLEVGETSASGAAAPGRAAARAARIAAVCGLVFGMLPPFSLPLLAAMVMVVIRPSRAALAAACAAAWAVALIGLRGTSGLWAAGLPPVIHALLGLLFLIEAGRSRPDDGRSWLKVAAVLAASAALWLIAAGPHLSLPLPRMQLHTWARHDAAVIVALLGVAAVLWTARRPRSRLAGSALVATAAVVAALGSTWFRDRFGDDPLAIAQQRLTPTPLPAQLVRTARVPGYVDALRWSTGGRWAAREAARDPRTPARLYVERDDGTYATLAASDAAFVDGRLATLERAGETSLLRLRRPEPDLPVELEIRLPDLPHPSLRVTPESWEVASVDLQESRGVRLRGDWRSPTFERETWSARDDAGVYLAELTVGAGGAIAVRGWFDVTPPRPLDGFAFLMRFPFVTELASVTAGATMPIVLTTAQIRCTDPPAATPRMVCTGAGIDRDTRIWTVDPAVADLAPVGAVRGVFHTVAHLSAGEALLLGVGTAPVLVDLAEARAWELRPSDGPPAMARAGSAVGWLSSLGSPVEGPVVQAATVAGETVVLATGDGGETRIAVYRIGER